MCNVTIQDCVYLQIGRYRYGLKDAGGTSGLLAFLHLDILSVSVESVKIHQAI